MTTHICFDALNIGRVDGDQVSLRDGCTVLTISATSQVDSADHPLVKEIQKHPAQKPHHEQCPTRRLFRTQHRLLLTVSFGD
jgi:hypothetical protein